MFKQWKVQCDKPDFVIDESVRILWTNENKLLTLKKQCSVH